MELNKERVVVVKKTTRMIGVLTAGFLTLGVGVGASALSYSGSTYGSTISTEGAAISLTDDQPDGQFPAVNYKYAGGTKEAGFANKNGYGSTVSKSAPSVITAIQPCISRTALPALCGNWIW